MISDADLKSIVERANEEPWLASVHEMAAELLAYRQRDKTPCRWEQDMDGNWETGCGNLFSYIEGGPKENDTKFCQYCGHLVEEVNSD